MDMLNFIMNFVGGETGFYNGFILIYKRFFHEGLIGLRPLLDKISNTGIVVSKVAVIGYKDSL